MGWNDLLRSFTVLALCWAGAEKMLQEGRLRQAARMVFGLLSLLVWLSGLQGLLAQVLPAGTESSETLLEAGVSSEVQDVWAVYAQHMDWQAEEALRAAGCDGQVEVTLEPDAGITGARLSLYSGDASKALEAVAQTLALPVEAIQQE